MYEFGTIVLVPFPFTDLTSAKVRPALIVSNKKKESEDVILCFITSKIDDDDEKSLVLESNTETGLKVRSAVRFDKIATLSRKVILGELGRVDLNYLQKNSEVFYRTFGFRD